MSSWNIELPATMYFSSTVTTCPYTLEKLDNIIREVEAAPLVAIDTETTGLNRANKRTGKSGSGEPASVPLYWSIAWGTNRRATLHVDVLTLFNKAFRDPTKAWGLANAKFDMHMLANIGILLFGKVYDVQVMHALMYEDKPHNLKYIAKHVLGWTWADFQDQFGKIGARQTAEELIRRAERENFDLLVEYAANDAWGTLKSLEKLWMQLAGENTFSLFNDKPPYIQTLLDYFLKIEAPYTRVLWKMERAGALVDIEKLDKALPEAEREIKNIEKEITRQVGRPINLRSTLQLRQYLIVEQGLKPLKYTKGGNTGQKQASIDASFLEHHRHNHPVCALLCDHRDYTKLLSTYIIGLRNQVDTQGRIHPQFNQNGARTGRLSSSEPNCFSGDTEVLTPNGWVRFDQLPEDVSVAQWDGGVIEFVQPTSYIKVSTDSLLHIGLTQVDLLVTHNHRCLLQHRKSKALHVFTAEEYPEDYQQINAGEYTGRGLQLSTEELQWLIAVQADGHITDHIIDLAFRKKRKVNRLSRILKAIQADYTLKVDSRNRYRFSVKGAARNLAVSYLTRNKVFGPWLLKLNRDQLDTFCEEIWFWDGCWTRKNHYASAIKTNADWVQTVLALSNTRARLRLYTGSKKDSWQVDASNRSYSLTTNRVINEIASADGKAYCVAVPSSFLLVRRNGCISVTGNCQSIPRPENDKWGLRDAFIAPEGMSIAAADYEQLEMRLLAAASMEESMIDIFRRGWDIHQGNASLMFDIPYEHINFSKGVIDKKIKHEELDPNNVLPFIQQEMPEMAAVIQTSGIDPLGYVNYCIKARGDAKAIGFGLNYGMGPLKLAGQIGSSLKEAKDKIAKYHETYGAVSSFFAEAVEEGRKYGYSFTVLGRRRNIPMISSHKKGEQAQGERLAVNTQIQGSASDVVKMAQLNIDAMGYDQSHGARMLLQIHDELVFEMPTEAIQEVVPSVVELMQHPFCDELSCPLTVSADVGRSWGQAK